MATVNEVAMKFARGLTQREDPEVAEGLLECQDVDFTSIGSIRAVKDNDSALAFGATVHSMSMEGLTNSEPLLCGVGSALYDGANVIRTGLSGGVVDFASINGRAYFTDGAQLFKYNGLAVWYAGTPAPSTAPTATDNAAAGGLDGTYNFKITFVNSDGYDGNESPVGSVTTGASNHTIDLTNIPVNSDTNYEVVSRHIWIQGGTSPYYPNYVLLATILDNTTTSYAGVTSTTITTAGDNTTVLETDNNLPPSGLKYVANHYGVLLAAGMDQNTLQFSKTNKPDQWPISNAFIVGKSGDPIMRPKPWNGATYVVSRKNINEMIGSPGTGILSTNFYIKTTMAQYGTIASLSVVDTPYGLFYWAEDGIRRFDGGKSEIFSYDVIDEFEARNKLDLYEKLTVGTFFDDKLIYSYCTSSSTTPDATLVYDFKTSTWRKHNRGYGAFAPDRRNRTLYCATESGVDRWQNGANYLAWAVKTAEKTGKVNAPSAWGQWWVDMEGEATAQIYYDGSLAGTQTLSAATRKLQTRHMPSGVAQRVSIRLSGTAKATQDKIYSVTIQGEAQGD